MNRILAACAMLAAATPAFAQMTVDDIQEKDQEIAKVLAHYAEKKGKENKLDYQHAYYDLNRDNRLDAVVLLEGPDWCTPEGCTMAVLIADKIGFELQNATAGVNPPIKVNPDVVGRYGYMPFILTAGDGREVALKYQQLSYPNTLKNASAASKEYLSTAKTLIDK